MDLYHVKNKCYHHYLKTYKKENFSFFLKKYNIFDNFGKIEMGDNMKALITGASSGIGRDMAYYLGELGCDLILVSRDKDKLMKVANKIKTNTEVLAYDLSKTENCYKLFEKVKDQNIDLVVNGAGFGLFGNAWETDLDRELEMIDLNIKAVHVLTKLFLPQMMKRDSGHILNIASSAGFLSGPILNTYYASKNYVAKWTLALYEELRRTQSNVKISCLCPGPVNTNFNKTAGGSFNLKGLSSEYVAKYGIDNCLKGKLLIVPGVMVRLGLFFNRFVSNKVSLKIVYHIQNKKVRGGKNI